MKTKGKSNIIIYQAPNGAIELKEDFDKETVWASQAQMATLFDVDQSVLSRHIKNIFKDGEVDQKSNMQKMHIPNSDKPVVFYSLDVILTIGYRTNSRTEGSLRKQLFPKWNMFKTACQFQQFFSFLLQFHFNSL